MKMSALLAVLSLIFLITLSTTMGVVARQISTTNNNQQRLDRIDFHYGYFPTSNDGLSQENDIASSPVHLVKTLDGEEHGASPMKNKLKGPADMGIYYINSAGRSCGGLSTSQCSKGCGALGYPVYWCYATVCYCHYGTIPEDQVMDNDIQLPII